MVYQPAVWDSNDSERLEQPTDHAMKVSARTTEAGAFVLEAGATRIDPVTAKASRLLKALNNVQWPMGIVVMGDSTGNNDDEWCRLFANNLASKFPAYTVNYRVYNASTSQYDDPTNIATGTAGRAYLQTGTSTTNRRFVIADAAAVRVTGDIDIRVRMNLGGSLPSAVAGLCGKWGAAGTRAWFIDLQTNGTIQFQHSNDGTATISRTSLSALAGTQLTDDIWLRVQLDVDNGATGNTCTFSTSTDGVTWTNLGAPSVIAGTTTINAGSTDVQFIGRNASSMGQQDHDFKFHAMRVYASLDGSARKVDIDVGGIFQNDLATALPMVDDVGNVVTLVSTYGTFGGAPRLAIFNASVTGAVIADATTNYAKFVIGKPDAAIISYGHNDTSDIEYRTDYKALTDALLTTFPDMCIVATLQNKRKSPAVSIYQHSIRMEQVRRLALSQNFDIVNVFDIWDDNYTNSDGIHPNSTGGVVWADVVSSVFGIN